MVENKATSTRVTIFGETYSIKSQAEPEYTNKVAEHVDQTMHMIKKQVGLQDPIKIAILASMSITDELLQTRETAEKKNEELENKCSSLINLIQVYLEGKKAEEVFSG